MNRRLFFSELDTFERFEDFVVAVLNSGALAKSFETGDDNSWKTTLKITNRYGAKGEDQRGIDLLGRLSNGKQIVFQCKYHAETAKQRKVGKPQANKAIKLAENKYPQASHYVLITNTDYTAPAQTALADAGWSFLRGEEFFDSIQFLPAETGYLLVKEHLGLEYAHQLYGDLSLELLLSPTRYKKSFNRGSLDHSYECVGREEEIEILSSALTTTKPRAIILSGDGGVGKSRVFCEVLEALDKRDDLDVKVLNSDDHADPKRQIDLLPQSKLIIGMDECQIDGFFRQDVAKALRLSRKDGRLLIVTRPEAVPEISTTLRQQGWDVHQPLERGLGLLTQQEMVSLASEIVGRHDGDVVNLAQWSDGLPLVVTVGGKLMREYGINAFGVFQEEGFVEKVYAKLEQDFLKDSSRDQLEVDQQILRLLSMLSPFSESCFSAISELLKLDAISPIRRVLERLRKLGLVRGTAKSQRIVPDVFSEYLSRDTLQDKGSDELLRGLLESSLWQDSIDKIGGKAIGAFARAEGEGAILHLFVQKYSASVSERFKQGDDKVRADLLSKRKTWGHCLPDETLELCRLILTEGPSPIANGDFPFSDELVEFNYSEVRNIALDLLSRIARFSRSQQHSALEYLWRFRQHTENPNSQEATPLGKVFAPDRYRNDSSFEIPFAWLGNLIDEDPGFPWVRERSEELQTTLGPAFEAFFETNCLIGNQMSLSAGRWSIERTQHIKDSVFEIISKIYSSSKIGALNVIPLLSNVVGRPHPPFGGTLPDEWFIKWLPIRQKALDHLEAILGKFNDASITFAIRAALNRHAPWEEKDQDEIDMGVLRLLEKIEMTPELAFSVIVNSAYWDEDRRESHSDEAQRHWQNLCSLGVDYLRNISGSEGASKFCDNSGRDFENKGFQTNFWDVFFECSKRWPEVIPRLVDYILENPECSYARCYTQLTSYLPNPDERLVQALATGNELQLRLVIAALDRGNDFSQYRLTLNQLKEICQSADEKVLDVMIDESLMRYRLTHQICAFLLSSIQWCKVSADQILQIEKKLSRYDGFTGLPKEVIPQILKQIEKLGMAPSSVSDLVLIANDSHPELAFEFLEKSVRIGIQSGKSSRSIFPEDLEGAFAVGGSTKIPEFERKAEDALDAYLHDPENLLKKKWFEIGFLNASNVGRDLMIERLKSADEDSFNFLVNIVSSSRALLALYQPLLTEALLDTARTRFPLSYDKVRKRLLGSIYLMSQSYTNGIPENRTLVETARKHLVTYADVSELRSFYDDLVRREVESAKSIRHKYEKESAEEAGFQ